MKKNRKSRMREFYASLPPAAQTTIALSILGIGGLVIYKVGKNQLAKWKMSQDIKQFKTKTIKELNINLTEIAKDIYDALKLQYPKWDPRSWNEDEEAATLALLKVPKPFIPKLEQEYLKNYKRNLRDDLQSYLDNYWDQVRYLFV